MTRKEREAERKEHIKLLRIQERRKIRENEQELQERLEKKSQIRHELKTTANKHIMIKAESAKLRQWEINEFKQESEIDRKLGMRKILQKHIDIERNYEGKLPA